MGFGEHFMVIGLFICTLYQVYFIPQLMMLEWDTQI
jgi:hypothetical protein